MTSKLGWDFDTSANQDRPEFTKFPVGETIIRVVDEMPHQHWTHWINKVNRSVNCPGKGCPICEIRKNQKAEGIPYTYNVAKRIAIQIINRETGKLEIMEQGRTFFEDLRDIMADLHEQGKKLVDIDIRVRRRGEGKNDTSYRLDIDKEYPLSDKDKELIENKVDLNEFFKSHEPSKIVRILNGEAWDEVMYENTKTNEKDEDIEVA